MDTLKEAVGAYAKCREVVIGCEKKIADNPINQEASPKRQTGSAVWCTNARGGACRSPAIRGRTRCRLHGGLSPGAPRGTENGNFRDGNWTVEAIQERKWLRSLVTAFAQAS